MIANKNPAAMHIASVEETTSRSIGNILVTAGRLTPEAAEKIHSKQRESDVLFGEAGISMGLISREDVEFAISRQFEYSVLKKGDSQISEKVVAAYDPFGPRSEAFRELRTHLLLRWFESETRARTLSVLSAQRNEGRSYVAANLAVSFSQLGHKTLLIDANFRNARLHEYFGISNRRGLSTLLQSKGSSCFFLPVDGMKNLSLLPSGPLPPNPQELLSQTYFSDLLIGLAKHFDLVILDTAAASLYSDATAVSLRTSASIVVARKGHTQVDQLKQMNDSLERAGGKLLGSVLVDF
jgi:protein-tyrosine kinase